MAAFAGSYPFAEVWQFNAPESEVVKAIEEIKKIDPNLKSPLPFEPTPKRIVDYDYDSAEMKEYLEEYLKDSSVQKPALKKSNSKEAYWLYIDFFLKYSNQIEQTWTRPNEDSTTTFALVGISNYDNQKETKLINKDFGYFENRRQINLFKALIVDKIQKQIDKNKLNKIINY